VSHASEQAGQEAGAELERLQGSAPVPGSRDGPRSSEAVTMVSWPQLEAWARGRGVVLAGLVLIAAQLIWKSFFLGHFYFWQDDFHFTELALSHSFSWSYLTPVVAGHLFPGVNGLVWVVARLSPYDWTLASAVTVVMLAAAGLAALRLLRTLFGNRPAILIPLTVYLLCPLTMPDIRWWAAAIESLPLQIAIFTALNAQVCYARTGRFRHAVAAAAWLLFGLVFFEKALVVPLLLLGVTSGFLMEGPWLRAIGQCLVRYWRAWLLQVAVLAGYAVLFVTSLHTSSVQPGIPGSAGGAFTFSSKIVKNTFVPGAIGGPWHWLASSNAGYAYSAPSPALTWLALIVAAAIIAASIWSRRHAWRAWAILAGWLAADDIAPILLGRVTELGPGVLGLETRYVADAVAVLAICVGLAFWPVAGNSGAATRRWLVVSAGQPGNVGTWQLGRMAAAVLVSAFVIGSLWSVQAFENVTTSAPARTYIGNARTALAQTPAGTVIVDSRVPPALMIGTFGSYADASAVVKPLESAGSAARIRWTTQPAGTIDRLMVFGSDGRLHQAGIYGPGSVPFPTARRCQPVRHGRSIVRFTFPTFPGTRVLHLAYLATVAAGGRDLTVSYGSQRQVLAVKEGLHSAYFPERGSVDSVTLSGTAIAAGLCVGGVQAGIIAPSSTGPVIPAVF
jgi:hypothetical protein